MQEPPSQPGQPGKRTRMPEPVTRAVRGDIMRDTRLQPEETEAHAEYREHIEHREHRTPHTHRTQTYQPAAQDRLENIVKALGWFSIGLGVAELLAPRQVGRAIGVQGRPGLLRTMGARELISGIGILRQPQPANWLWARVAGDALDLALLGNASRRALAAASGDRGDRRIRLTAVTAAVVGITVLDVIASMQKSQQKAAQEGRFAISAVKVEKSIVINRPPGECYQFWKNFENLPRFMRHLESVRTVGENRTRWRAKGPAGTHVEWDAEVTADEPDRLLAWQSVSGSVDNIGTLTFDSAPGGRGTLLRVELQYSPPGGTAGAAIARLFGEEPSAQIAEDLRRFKWLIETGEIPTTIGQPSGPRGAINRLLWRKGEPG